MSDFLARTYKRVEGNPWQTLEEETLIISPKDHISHETGGVGSYIWGFLTGEMPLISIVDYVCSEFEVARDVAEEDLIQFIQQLEDRGLVICQV